MEYNPKIGTDLDHLEWREALPSKVGRVLRQGVLRLGHSRRSGLHGVDPTAAESNIVTTTRDIGKHARARTTPQILPCLHRNDGAKCNRIR
jgi:hypothetical protein